MSEQKTDDIEMKRKNKAVDDFVNLVMLWVAIEGWALLLFGILVIVFAAFLIWMMV